MDGMGIPSLGRVAPSVFILGNSHFLIHSLIPPVPTVQLIRARSFRGHFKTSPQCQRGPPLLALRAGEEGFETTSSAYYFTEVDRMKHLLFGLLGFLLACVALAAPAPDPLKDWGNPVNPDQDCKIQRDGGTLSIEMPGTDHDYDPTRKQLNAPRILREVEGDFDLQVRIRIDCPASARSSAKGQPACVSAGFIMIFPDTYPFHSFCNRLDYGLVQQRIGIKDFSGKALLGGTPQNEIEKEPRKGIGEDGCLLWQAWSFHVPPRRNGELIIDRERLEQVSLIILDRGWRDWPMPRKADCAYLRMEQRGHRIQFFLSPDGEKWTEVIWTVPGLPAKGKVGLAAYTTSSEPSKVRFDQIKFAQRKKKER
jgi:hypothetical protein